MSGQRVCITCSFCGKITEQQPQTISYLQSIQINFDNDSENLIAEADFQAEDDQIKETFMSEDVSNMARNDQQSTLTKKVADLESMTTVSD